MARQFIYHMQGLTKTYPGGKKVLENINLSFYPDAKIGVLGVNGAGKSTLLRDHGRHRQGVYRRRLRRRGRPRRLSAAGAAARPDPRRARQRHARRRRQEGDSRSLQRSRHELFGRDRRRDDEAPGRDRGQGPVGPRQPGRSGHGRARLPARRRRRRRSFPAASGVASRSASCCWSSPNCCCSTSRPTISTPKPSIGSKDICANIPARS